MYAWCNLQSGACTWSPGLTNPRRLYWCPATCKCPNGLVASWNGSMHGFQFSGWGLELWISVIYTFLVLVVVVLVCSEICGLLGFYLVLVCWVPNILFYPIFVIYILHSWEQIWTNSDNLSILLSFFLILMCAGRDRVWSKLVQLHLHLHQYPTVWK